jgi:formiminotetrahydrofolate cyclodeaminase
VLEARRLPAEDPARAARIADALEAASRTPAAIAAAAERVAELADEVVAHGRASVAGDAAAGASLARAAGAAAAHLVALNRAG